VTQTHEHPGQPGRPFFQGTKSQLDSDSLILRARVEGQRGRLSNDSVSQRDDDSTIQRFVALRQLRYSEKSYNESSVLTRPAVTFRETDVKVHNTKSQRVRRESCRSVVPEKCPNLPITRTKHHPPTLQSRKPAKSTPLCARKKHHCVTLTVLAHAAIHVGRV
jgi:hypothetical protein